MMTVCRFLQHKSQESPVLVRLVPVITMLSSLGQLIPIMEATSSSHCLGRARTLRLLRCFRVWARR